MRSYRRVRIAEGSYFFTVNLAERRDNDLLLRQIDALRDAFRRTKRDHPLAMCSATISLTGRRLLGLDASGAQRHPRHL